MRAEPLARFLRLWARGGSTAAVLGLLAVAAPLASQQDGADAYSPSHSANFGLDSRSQDLTGACAVQRDGAVIVAGSATDDDTQVLKIAVARFLATGAPDSLFGNAGRMVIDQSAFGRPYISSAATAVALLGNEILIGGWQYDVFDNTYYAFLVAMLPDGSVDPTFGVGGWMPLTGVRSIVDLEVSPANGDIWLLAEQYDGQDRLIKFDRFETQVSLVAADGVFTDLEIQPDGKALIVGSTDIDPTATVRYTPVLRRYLANLTPDPSVGAANGVMAYDYGDARLGRSVGVRPNGSLILQGTKPGALGADDLFVLALDRFGNPDHYFGFYSTTNIAFDIGGSDSDGGLGRSSLAIQSDGKIVVAARVMTGNGHDIADVGVARLTPAGGFDLAFGGAGTGKRVFELGETTLPGLGTDDNDDVETCLVLSGGRAVISGHSHTAEADWDFAIQRLESSLIFADAFEFGSRGFWGATTPP